MRYIVRQKPAARKKSAEWKKPTAREKNRRGEVSALFSKLPSPFNKRFALSSKPSAHFRAFGSFGGFNHAASFKAFGSFRDFNHSASFKAFGSFAPSHPFNKPFALKLFLMIMLMAAIIITHTACGKKEPPSQIDFCLDTSCQITIYDDVGEGTAEGIAQDAFQEIHKHEKLLSKTVSGSDVDRINQSGGTWTDVSEETIAVINMANEISEKSGGVFDVTIGAVNDLWDFKGENPKAPDSAVIAKALPSVDYRRIKVEEGGVLLENPSAQLDLGGVAKGYIADRAAEFLEEERGVDRAVINLGGNVVVLGEKDEKTPWVIGIERPFTDRTEIIGTIEVSDATVVTSGIYERNFEENGVLYHHILDPKTGYPVETDLEAVTITAKKGQSGFCDAVSTACLLLGKERALQFIEQIQREYPDIGLEAALIDKNDDIVQTKGMHIQFSGKE